ncbi:MAG: DUF4199 domain-containing protein [Bacteroidales bacterium]|nr:DUF4199 domain-containing protein [Bacteroidales bacterium]
MQSKEWSIAALDALLLSIITIVVSLIQVVFEPGTVISILLWLVKFVGCLALLYYFIKEFSKSHDTFTYKEGFSFGFKICLLSSVVLAAFNFLQYAVLFPDAMQTAMEQVIVAMQSSNPDAADSMERYQSKLPQLVSVITLFYYTVFGLIASAVIANYTKKGDIFTNNSI